MALFTTGRQFIQDLEKSGALGIYVPSEGGFEGRYQRRLRAAGYSTLHISAPGLGDLPSYLTQVHGVRPPHLGKSTQGNTDWGVKTFFLPPLVNYHLENLPPKARGLVLWMIDGKRLSRQELAYLSILPAQEPKVKIVIELGGDRQFRWQPLKEMAAAA
uniref:NAD(P)H-quinone oxidoreductase subunit N n=1 Tax=Cyanothece sp. (strain PCC 7425 / ATCC 29141) TaxID=395961 RepID=NDHN_CYAP4|nr:RecName: Full=NAD(P)H-quinone oxidoreductase subunit N; AltName: Full=NAD(P)H dehydrogenase I subunit N; Short=NDH-1 subunit N; Short=NDH-N [Cyanothece sp. PCC 7425]